MKPKRYFKTQTRWLTAMFVVAFGAFFIGGCTGGGAYDDASQPTPSANLDDSVYDDPEMSDSSPRLRIMMTDAPTDAIENVWLTISEVSAKHDSQGWITVSTDVQTIDLLALRYGVADTLGLDQIPAGTYSELRLLVTDAAVVDDGATYDLFVPSGATSGVKIKFHFTVSEGELATMLIDWDAKRSIHYAPGEGYIMRPVIQVRSYRIEELDEEPPPAPDLASDTHPDSFAWSSATTASFQFSATDNIGMDGFSYLLDTEPETLPDETRDRTDEEKGAYTCIPSEYDAPPTCTEVEPSIILPGGVVSIYGTDFGRWSSMITVNIGGVNTEVVEVSDTLITVRVPELTLGPKAVEITTPEGVVECNRELEIIGDTMFCPDGENEPGKGLLGHVNQLPYQTKKLPDPNDYGEAHSSIVACELNVPNHRFEEGFPGVDSTLVEWFSIYFEAKLVAPVAGDYEFKVASDDGSLLYIDDELVVDNDGLHPVKTRYGDKYLSAGQHDFVVHYYQGPRWYIALQVYWKRPDSNKWEIIPKDYFLIPQNEKYTETVDANCFCSGHGAGAYDYRAYAANDGDGKLYSFDIYDEVKAPVEIGTIMSGNATLSDFEALTIKDGNFYGINNDGTGTTRNRLYRLDVEGKEGGVVQAIEQGVLQHGGSTVNDVDCLALAPDGQVYGISTDTQKLYTVNLSSGDLTYVMDVPGEVEACAFGPSGVLYGMDNQPSNPNLVRINPLDQTTDIITAMNYRTDIESMAWHPDGFLYIGIDNSSNSYPALVKIRPSDGFIVEEMDPSVKWSDVEGLEFDYDAERSTCACDMELNDESALYASGTIEITDYDGDSFSETVSFTGDQLLLSADPADDSLNNYTGVDYNCFLPKGKVLINDLQLDPNGRKANRFGFTDQIIEDGFMLQVIKDDCSYETIVTADISTEDEYIFSTGNHGEFWIKLLNPQVNNAINSNLLAALDVQDEPGAIMFNIQLDQGSMQNDIRRGVKVVGTHSFTIQPGKNVIAGDEEAGDLPICPDPALHEPYLEGSATYKSIDDGIYYFHVRGVDDSGNWGDVSHYRVMIDSSPPLAPVVTSSTHPAPEMEYENASPVFEWTMDDLSGIDGYSFILDVYPDTNPPDEIMGTEPTTNFEAYDPGEYYFHVKGVNGTGLWSETTHFKVTIVEPTPDRPTAPIGFQLNEGGVFRLGCPEGKDCFGDEDLHWVELSPYLIMQKEVTNAEYQTCVSMYTETSTPCNSDSECVEHGETFYCNSDNKCATGCENRPNPLSYFGKAGYDQHPVNYVTWYDANQYCRSFGYRLPTEAEWEYAANGASGTRYPWGEEWDAYYANGDDITGEPKRTGTYDGAHTGYGDGSRCVEGGRCIYDMTGNVAEWVADWYGPYPEATSEENPAVNPSLENQDDCKRVCVSELCRRLCEMKTIRGGSFEDVADKLRVFYREKNYTPMDNHANIGFRCALTWDESMAVKEVCDGVDNDFDERIDEGFDDMDGDGQADCIDTDDDGDGVPDNKDNCPLRANSDQADPDMDGMGEVCDSDGETLLNTYRGLVRPWDVVVDPTDSTIYVAGTHDATPLLGNDMQGKLGSVLSINSQHVRTGQIAITDPESDSGDNSDFRPNAISLSPQGFLYVTDEAKGKNDGIWKIVRDPKSNQLSANDNPVGEDGEAGGTERFWMGDNTGDGIDKTSGNTIDPMGEWIYVTRKSKKQIHRFPLLENGDISDEFGKDGEIILDDNGGYRAPAIAPDGKNLYFMRWNALYRMKIEENELVWIAERISDGNAFKNAIDLEFDSTGNLFILSEKGKSNKWPFIGSPDDKVVFSKSGYISKVAKEVLEEASSSNIIRHADETKQTLVYGGPASREISYEGKRLNQPQGFDIMPDGKFVIANTLDDEVVILDTQAGVLVDVIPLAGEYDGL